MTEAMMLDRIVEVFCEVDDFCQAFVPQWEASLMGTGGPARRGPEPGMSPSEIITLLLVFHSSGFKYLESRLYPGQSGEARIFLIQDDNLTAEVPLRRSILQSTLRQKYRSTGRHNPQRDGGPEKGLYRLHPIALRLYLIEARATPNRLIHVYDVVENGTALANRRIFFDCGKGTADGFKADIDGNLWCGWGMGEAEDGVVVLSPKGKMIGRIRLPERCANLCFGGENRNRLFMASSRSIYALYVNTQGAVDA